MTESLYVFKSAMRIPFHVSIQNAQAWIEGAAMLAGEYYPPGNVQGWYAANVGQKV